MKTLVIFDFDDTLFESNSQVIVKSPRTGTKYLSSSQYASFVPEHDDELDFSQFDDYPSEAKPIETTTKSLRRAVAKYGLDNVIILTARSRNKPIVDVLAQFGLPPIFVAAVGGSDPRLKADYTVRTIEEEDYTKVIVYEDNVKNIAAIRTAVVPLIGRSNFVAFNVAQQSGNHVLIRH